MPPKGRASGRRALEWLLEDEQPSIRYLALTTLLGRSEDDSAVQTARAAIPDRGWAHEILKAQTPGGFWVDDESLYVPKYLSTNWMLLILADLGMTNADPRIRKACELWIKRFAKPDGGFGLDTGSKSHLCTAGNMARGLVRFGYADHPKVRSAFEWFVKVRDKNGGWSCFGSGRNLDSWEPLSAFAVYPKAKWTAGMVKAVDDAAEFFLQRELHKQGDRYPPWYRFHYPVHYYYDLLVGLDFMTALGFGDDPRLRYAISVLKERQRADGRWNLDAVHPDVEGGIAEWFAKHPKRAPTPFALERVGEPSKMITLRAMQVVQRLEDGPRSPRLSMKRT